MKNAASLILALLACSPVLLASTDADTGKKSSYEISCFYSAVDEIRLMLEDTATLDYERAVFLTENAWYGNRLTYGEFQRELNLHESRIKALAAANKGQYKFRPSLHETAIEQQDRYDKALSNWAIFTYLTDTVLLLGEKGVTAHLPYLYSYDDPLGSKDWKNAQVIHLLTTRRGNCYAMTSLFRIFSARLKSDANIATAPGHVFVQHQDAGGATFNVELATRSFPGTGTIETLTYSTDESVRNGLSMRSLDLKQSVALCLVYLAKGYEHRFGSGDGSFALTCAELALQHDPLNLNAMLLKAEAMEGRIIEEMNANGLTSVAEATRHPALMSEIAKYEELIGRLYSLGYREMPIEMKNTLMGRVMNDGESPVLVHKIEPNIFERNSQIGVRYASLSGGLFDETYETKPFEKYSRTVWNTNAGKIERFEMEESLYNSYPYDPVVFAWSVDPEFALFPSMSPYSAFANNPLNVIDPDGRRIRPVNEGASVALEAHLESFGNRRVLERVFGLRVSTRGIYYSVHLGNQVLSRRQLRREFRREGVRLTRRESRSAHSTYLAIQDYELIELETIVAAEGDLTFRPGTEGSVVKGTSFDLNTNPELIELQEDIIQAGTATQQIVDDLFRPQTPEGQEDRYQADIRGEEYAIFGRDPENVYNEGIKGTVLIEGTGRSTEQRAGTIKRVFERLYPKK